MSQIIFAFAFLFDLVALGFVLLAGFQLLRGFFAFQTKKTGFSLSEKHYHEIRIHFVHRVILALDFFIVGDLLKLAFADTAEGLLKILLIVIIRTTLSYFLMNGDKLR